MSGNTYCATQVVASAWINVEDVQNLQKIFIELWVQHGHLRFDILVQYQGEYWKHGIDGRIPERNRCPFSCASLATPWHTYH